MSPEHLAQRIVERWVSTYTSGLDEQTAERRRAETRADLHDHLTHGPRNGHHPWRIAGEAAFRSLRPYQLTSPGAAPAAREALGDVQLN